MKTKPNLLIIFFACCSLNLSAAYLRFEPQKITQPDGFVVHCFATGDEYYHWLHDAKGFTIILNRETGYFVYADKAGDELVPTRWLPGIDDPSAAGLTSGLNISPEKYREYFNARYKEPSLKSPRSFSNTGDYNNLVVFVRFSNQNEYSESLTRYSSAFNAVSTVSLTEYFKEVSKSQLNIVTTFYPKPSGTTIVSYQDLHSRRYFQPYSASNPDGYRTDNEYIDREMTLLKNAAESVRAQVEASGIDYDHDNDGNIDNVCFVIQGPTDGWSDLLWPHRWVLYTYDVRIGGARVYDFNFQLSESFGVSVLCHEMFHSLGAPDLYRYENQDITPVGPWDLMAHNTSPPQHMSAYMKMKYGKWFSQIPAISADGTYSLRPLATDAYAAYKIASPNSTSEYFVLEYRKAAGRFESGLVGSGLIIYRVNPSLEGNAQGPPDEVYVYRQNGNSRADGIINNANFSSNVGRTEFGDNTNPSDFLSNGAAGGIRISNIGAIGETITFTVGSGGSLNPPRELTATLTARALALTWKKPDAGTGGTLAGYKVYRNQNAVSTINNPNTLTFSQADLADGTWQYHVTALYTSPAGESGPSNTVTVTVGTEARPDLIITNPLVEPLNVEPGGAINLSCRQENTGTAQAGTSMLRAYLSRDEVFDSGDRQLASGAIDPIDPGAWVDITGENIEVPSTTEVGNWFVLFIADADGTVVESIENNNQASTILTVGNPALNPPRNLVAQVAQSNVILSWMEPEPGGGTLAGYYVFRNENRIAVIDNPSTSEYTDSGLAVGFYAYYLIAFYSSPVGESPPSNEVAVTVASDAKPDLTPQDLALSPMEVASGGSIDISCSILNIGAATAGESVVRLYFSKDLIQDENDIYLAYGTIDPIEAGGGLNLTGADISLPGDLEPGIWNALLIVDATQSIDESNENNNQASTSVKVQGEKPDLQITNMVLFPSIITPMSNVRITFNVLNSGPVAAPVQANFYLSTDEALDPSDPAICDAATRILSGRSNIMMFSGFVMSPVYIPGQYFLIGVVNIDGKIDESDDTNNMYVMPVTLAATTGMLQEPVDSALLLFPVPASGKITVRLPGIPGQKVMITFTDLNGREIIHEERVLSGMDDLEWDTRGWPKGPGLVCIRLKDRILTGRFIIQ